MSVLICTFFILTSPLIAQQGVQTGAVIYKKLCVECHGAKGEGVKGKCDDPLFGDKSLQALARRIDRTMPEDNEGACVGEDANQVAAYIYDAFYSPAAQVRNRPVAKDFARLTIDQYRNSVADLLGRFRGGFDKPPGEVRGLNAHYSGFVPEPPKPGQTPEEKAKEKKEKKEREKYKLDRNDANISFSYGADSPDPGKLDPEQFNIRWEGSIIAEETGVYEFVIKTENGVRLMINGRKNALIDSWVTPGPQVREEKGSVFLLGGRSYPLVLEHFKYKDKSASIQLLWKPPHGALEVIPQRNLSPDRLRELMIVSTSFPADDRSVGYERGTGISKAWDQATTEAALAVVDHIDKNLDELAGSKAGAPDRVDKLKQFCRALAEAAFRRPLTDEQKELFVERHFKEAKTPELAVKRVVLLTLKSPRFLYPDLPLNDQVDDFDVATRLALNLWDSIPDRRLIQAAAEGKLKTREQVLAQAQRMLVDPRTKAKLHGFFHHWLELERAEAISKDRKAFPEFSEEVVADLRKSLSLFIDQVVWSPTSDYRELLQADYLLLNQRLAKFYGKEGTGEDFQRVAFNPKERSGVVTHPYLLAAFAYSQQSSPIHRGVFLTRNIIGMTLKSPPMAVAFEDSHFDPKLTMREKIVELTKDKACLGCHSVINPLGFTLENYDAVGRWRTKDNNKPINAVSDFATDDGKTLHLTGPRDIVQYAAESPTGQRTFIRQLFNHTVKQPVPAYGGDTLDKLRLSFTESGFNIQRLLVDIAVISAMQGLPAPVVAAAKPVPSPAPAPVVKPVENKPQVVPQQAPPAPNPAPPAPASVAAPSPSPAPPKP